MAFRLGQRVYVDDIPATIVQFVRVTDIEAGQILFNGDAVFDRKGNWYGVIIGDMRSFTQADVAYFEREHLNDRE